MNPVTRSLLLQLRYPILAAAAGLCVALAGTGCHTASSAASGTFASVTIQNHTAQEIADATTQVFAADGYRGGMNAAAQGIFEKAASRATSFAREGLGNAYYGAQTINRVRVETVPLGDGQYRLQCRASLVTGGSDPFFQDEVPLANARSAPYQALLEKVKKQLK